MNNIDIFKKLSKRQLLEKLLVLDTEYETWYLTDAILDLKKGINWLYKEMDPTIQTYLFPEETRKELESKYDELGKNTENEHPGHDASMPESGY